MSREEFYEEYVTALRQGNAAIFAGAGLSRQAGYVDWKELLTEIARDLGLEIDRELDLLAIAQYHYNSRQSRARLNQKLIEEFTEDAKLTPNHRLIASLPVRIVWTTNYDKLLEQAFEEARKRVDAKIVKDSLSTTRPKTDVTVYKMHGDISLPNEAVLLKDDYELYNTESRRGAFTTQLQGHLISHKFLFLGFSFTDPNIEQILSRIRILLGENRGHHYCIMRRIPKPARMVGAAKAEYEYEARKQELRIADLRRYHIDVLLIDEYAEVEEILQELNRRYRLCEVLVSGSAHEFGPRGEDSINELARRLGQEIIQRDYNLISGFGLGIGGSVIVGSVEAAYSDEKARIDERLTLRPFPQGDPPSGMTRQEFWKRYREDMISRCGFVVFISGNKKDPSTGDAVLASGVLQEFEICKALGRYPIPIGATGYAAEQIWKEVSGSLDQYYPGLDVKTHFATLGNPKKSNEELLKAVFALMKHVGAGKGRK
jgi:hypothetical protein